MTANQDSEGSAPAGNSALPKPAAWRRLGPAGIVVASTFLAYAATLRFGYIYDDAYLVISNYSLRSWRFLPVYFGGHIWSFVFPTSRANSYRPLLLMWLRLNYQLFGLHPWGWHLTIVTAHVAAAWLVFRLALLLTGNRWTATAAGLLFGLHPVHVETIAEASWADQPLSTLCMIAAVLAWWRSRRPQRNNWWRVASLVFAAAALLSKESTMALPILIGMLAWISWPRDGAITVANGGAMNPFARSKSALLAGAPYLAVVIAYVALRVQAMKVFSYILHPMTLPEALLSVPAVLVLYLRLLIWPVGLSCYYDTFYVSKPGGHNFGWPILLLAGVFALCVFWYRHTRRSRPEDARAMAFAFLWMVLTLLPVLNLRYLPKHEIVHDRYLYLPSVGFCILAAMGWRQALEALPKSCRRPGFVLPAALGFFGLLGLATVRQSLFWTDEMTLRMRAHLIAPHNVCATSAMGDILRFNGNNVPAAELYRQALAADPDYWPAVNGMGMLQYKEGNYPEAVRYLLHACNLMPTDSDALATLGMALLRMGRAREAEESLRAAIMVNPGGKNYRLGLALALEAEGRHDEAKQEIVAELVANPGNRSAEDLLRVIGQKAASTSDKTKPH